MKTSERTGTRAAEGEMKQARCRRSQRFEELFMVIATARNNEKQAQIDRLTD
jgi:hypothetical protein